MKSEIKHSHTKITESIEYTFDNGIKCKAIFDTEIDKDIIVSTKMYNVELFYNDEPIISPFGAKLNRYDIERLDSVDINALIYNDAVLSTNVYAIAKRVDGNFVIIAKNMNFHKTLSEKDINAVLNKYGIPDLIHTSHTMYYNDTCLNGIYSSIDDAINDANEFVQMLNQCV